MSGIDGRRRTIRYYDPDDPSDVANPVRRQGQATLSGVHFEGGSSYWIVRGLTCDREGLVGQSTITMRPDSERIALDHCLVQHFYQGGVICYGSHNTIQRCVVRQAQINSGIDTYGIMVTPQQGVPVVGVRALDCEVYDMVDMLAATVSSLPGDAFTEVGDLLHDGHDLHNSCRMWGLAAGTGGSGGSDHMMVFHRGARNWTVEDCILGEDSSPDAAAYHESVWQSQDENPDGTFGERGIVFRRNIAYAVHAAFGCTLDGQMLDNQVANCGRLFYKSSDSGRLCPTDPVITGTKMRGVNRLFDPDDAENPPYVAASNAELPGRHFCYERKRWTGPEIARAW